MNNAGVFASNDFSIPLTHFKIMRTRVVPVADVISAPVETGTQSFDNKVLRPDKVIITGSIDLTEDGSDADIERINTMYENRAFEFYSVNTKEGAYVNLILQSCPCDNGSDRPDIVIYELTFVEALLVQSQESQPANSENTSTRNNGHAMAS